MNWMVKSKQVITLQLNSSLSDSNLSVTCNWTWFYGRHVLHFLNVSHDIFSDRVTLPASSGKIAGDVWHHGILFWNGNVNDAMTRGKLFHLLWPAWLISTKSINLGWIVRGAGDQGLSLYHQTQRRTQVLLKERKKQKTNSRHWRNSNTCTSIRYKKHLFKTWLPTEQLNSD